MTIKLIRTLIKKSHQIRDKIMLTAFSRNLNSAKKKRLNCKLILQSCLDRVAHLRKFSIVAKNFQPSMKRSLKIATRRKVHKRRYKCCKRLKTKFHRLTAHSRVIELKVRPSKMISQICRQSIV